jgi:hypothetical protein
MYMEHTTIPDKQGLFRSPAEVRANRISSMKTSTQMHKIYTDAQEPKLMKEFVGPARSLREHILRMSLFPNIHNKETMLKEFQ